MLKGGIPIGRILGIPIRLHYSWFFIFILITWVLTANYFPTVYPSWSLAMMISAGLITSLLFFASVLVHELMHSIVALREGIQIQSITLLFLGGVSQMTGEPKKASDEFRMAAAGPTSSLVLGGIFLGIFFAARSTNTLSAQFIAAISYYLGVINIILGVFNFIPGFPMDGGRVLRSLIWWRTKNLKSATRVAAGFGRGIGFLFMFGGIWLIFTNNFFNGLWLALIGWFLESSAAGSYQQMLLQDMLKGHTASEIMRQDCMTVSPDLTIERLVNENIMSSGRRCFPVTIDGKVEGLVTLDSVRTVPRDRWNTTEVKQYMTTLAKLKSVGPNADLNTVLQMMTENDINQVRVVYEGKIVGMVSRDNLITFIQNHALPGR